MPTQFLNSNWPDPSSSQAATILVYLSSARLSGCREEVPSNVSTDAVAACLFYEEISKNLMEHYQCEEEQEIEFFAVRE